MATVPGVQPTGADPTTSPSTALAPTSKIGEAPSSAIPQMPTMIWETPQFPPEPKEITTPEDLEYSDLGAADQQKIDLMISAERQAQINEELQSRAATLDPAVVKAAYLDSRQAAIDAAAEAEANLAEDMQEAYGEPLPEGQADKAVAGSPGTFQPESGTVPANKSKMAGVVAQPTTLWTQGQHVVLADGSKVFWNGSSWSDGDSPVGGVQSQAKKREPFKGSILKDRNPKPTQIPATRVEVKK